MCFNVKFRLLKQYIYIYIYIYIYMCVCVCVCVYLNKLQNARCNDNDI